MNPSDVLSKMSPEMLKASLNSFGGTISSRQMAEIEKAIKSVDKGELNKQLNNLSADALKQEFSKNPEIMKMLTKNPELMRKIDEIFKK